MKTMCMYYGGKSLYNKDNLVTGYSRHTRQFLHYLYMFSHCNDFTKADVYLARDYMELYRINPDPNERKYTVCSLDS